MSEQTLTSSEPVVDYGLDAPSVMYGLMATGLLLLLLGLSHAIPDPSQFCEITGPIVFLQGLMGLCYSKFGKQRHRDRLLSLLQWKGTETVLDVGTGRGLLLIGAAKRLTSGRAVGIDVWSPKDLSNNKIENTLANATAEGVRDRVQVITEDAQKMSFADESFDVVLSNLAIHNIPSAAGRAKAIREVARVLRPGGTAIISDFQKTKDYAKEFRAMGLEVSVRRAPLWQTFFPLKIVEAKKTHLADSIGAQAIKI